MILVDYATQIKELTGKGEYDEAISLLRQLELALYEEKEEKIKELQMLKAERLFAQGKYQDAMDLFTEVAAPPARVIKLFPPTVAGDLSDQKAPAEPVAETPEDKDAPPAENGTPEEEPSQKENGETETTPTEGATPTTPKENGTSYTPEAPSASKLGYFGLPVRLKLGGGDDAASIRSGRSVHRDGETRRSPSPSPAPGHTSAQVPTGRSIKKLEGDRLKKAVQGLISYLVNMRTKLLKYVKPDLDLDVLEAQVQTPEKLALSNGDPTNSTPTIDLSGAAALLPLPESGEELSNREQLETLLEMAKIVDTALMRSYMLTNPRLVGSLVRLDNFCDPDVMHEKLIETGRFKELVDYLAKKKLHKKGLVLLKSFGDREEPDDREPGLHGPRATVEYLQRLHADQLPLIFEYSTWVLRKDPKLGMQIFTDDTPQAESLPRHSVLDFLKSVDVKLTVQYVEHLIHELKDDSPEYHNWLIEGYLILMREKRDHVAEDGWTWKLSQEERTKYAKRVLNFTEDSQQYWPEKIIKLIPTDDPTFYEIRASVLSRLGEHRQALEIFVFKMQDFIKAEAYCNRVHQTSPPSSDPAETSTETVYSILLSLYLSPPSGSKPQIEPALSLLSRHGARVDPLATLKLIPESIGVAELELYFENRIRHSNTRVNMNRVMAQLYKAEAFRWEELSADAKKKAVVIGEERVCPCIMGARAG
ncbi:hypothetical protein ABW21_db0203732 [Orbilia brochopaga]|nr:hypothetical protein ABW21_db0203732 [Drechslerella brochopaga]